MPLLCSLTGSWKTHIFAPTHSSQKLLAQLLWDSFFWRQKLAGKRHTAMLNRTPKRSHNKAIISAVISSVQRDAARRAQPQRRLNRYRTEAVYFA